MPAVKPKIKDCFGFFFTVRIRSGMSDIQARKERLNFGKERAVKPPLNIAREKSRSLEIKVKPPLLFLSASKLRRRDQVLLFYCLIIKYLVLFFVGDFKLFLTSSAFSLDLNPPILTRNTGLLSFGKGSSTRVS